MTAMTQIKPQKFRLPDITADGEQRASVKLKALETLWINTGTLCNLTCKNCYIESSPTNDSLVYVSASEVITYLDEIKEHQLGTTEIGFTGGEPFMNPEFPNMMEAALSRGYRVLVLTNAMKPMMKMSTQLKEIHARHPDRLVIRVSLDHHTQDGHEMERGARSWGPALNGLSWLRQHGFTLNIAGRTFIEEDETDARDSYAALFARLDLAIDAHNPAELVLFPEMDASLDVPEITTSCWGILNVEPDSLMCASSRMVVKRKGADTPVVVACTLLPYDPQFELGQTLTESSQEVPLNHPHCARFCVLGGAACS